MDETMPLVELVELAKEVRKQNLEIKLVFTFSNGYVRNLK